MTDLLVRFERYDSAGHIYVYGECAAAVKDSTHVASEHDKFLNQTRIFCISLEAALALKNRRMPFMSVALAKPPVYETFNLSKEGNLDELVMCKSRTSWLQVRSFTNSKRM